MERIFRWIMVVCLLLAGATPGRAGMTTTLRKGLTMNWFYYNTDANYPRQIGGPGYFYDYNKDGLLDYLILLQNPTTCNWRLFALNTAATGGEKTYAANRTAARDIAASFGNFVPETLYTPQSPSMSLPDLVILATNKASASASTFTQFKFRRLNETSTSFADDGSLLTIPGVSSKFRIYWPNCSFDGDDYPDFIMYNAEPINNQFTLRCYNGKLTSSTPMWTRSLSLDAEDPGTGVDIGSGAMLTPTLGVQVLPKLDNNWQSSDFDGNGKPEIFLYYSFGKGTSFANMTAVLDIDLLNSSGGFVSPYSSTWTRVSADLMASAPPSPMIVSDYNQDGYVDMVLMRQSFMTTTPSVFEAYNLKGRASLFKTTNKDFSLSGLSTPSVLDLYGYVPYLHNKSTAGPADLTGDGYNDLDVYRMNAVAPSMPLRVALFHGYAGGGSNKGRRIWLQEFANYSAANWNANDFDADGLQDYVLTKNPDAPSTPTLNKVTWKLATTSVKKTGISILKEFTYAPSHEFGTFNATTDEFQAYSGQFAGLGDLDNDGRRDTCGSFQCWFDRGGNGTIDLSYGLLLVFDNTSGSTAPETTAELEIKIKDEDWAPFPIMVYAFGPDGQTFVDNNGDGSVNDFAVRTEKAVHALSFTYKPVTVRNAARGWVGYR